MKRIALVRIMPGWAHASSEHVNRPLFGIRPSLSVQVRLSRLPVDWLSWNDPEPTLPWQLRIAVMQHVADVDA